MDEPTRKAYDSRRDFRGKAFRAGCYAPFVSIWFNPVGDVIACCRNQTDVLGNVGRQRLDDIWTGARTRELREHLVDYRFGGGCEFCGWMIDAGDYRGAITHLFDVFDAVSVEPEFPRQMEFAISNTCNFACVQCCGLWSSRIRSEREGLPPLARPYGDEFFADLRRYLPHLERAKFYGGEPFLAPENYRIWEMMIEDGSRLRCHALTNGSVWNQKVERVLESLVFSIGVSLDAISSKEALERIRIGADYDTLLENMRRFREYTRSRGEPMLISFSFMRQNWRELAPILLHCEENGYWIDVIRVVDPPQFSLFSLPRDEMLRIADQLEAQGEGVLPHLDRLRSVWTGTVESLRANAGEAQQRGYGEVSTGMRRSHIAIANELCAQKRWREALEEARKTPPSHQDYLFALLTMAHCSRRLGELEAADALSHEACSLGRRYAPAFVERAWLRIDQDRHAEAVEEARRALAVVREDEAGSERDRATQVLIRGLVGCDRRQEVLDAVARWERLRPGNPGVAIECARALAGVGRRGEALRRLVGADVLGLRDEAERVEALTLRAHLRRECGDLAGARSDLDAGFALDDRDASLHLEEAWLCAAEGRAGDGIEAALRARAVLPAGDAEASAWTSHCLGHLHAAAGNPAAAAVELERFLERHPHHRGARETLEGCRAAIGGDSA